MRSGIWILGATIVVTSGCHDGPTNASRRLAVDALPGRTARGTANATSSTSSVRWNRTAIALFRDRGGNAGRLNAYLPIAAQRTEPSLGAENNSDFAADEAIGRGVAAAVLAFAASDNIGLTSPGVPAVGPGFWVSSAVPIVPALEGIAQQPSMSRVYAGIHSRFDGEGGLAIGRAAARLALERHGLE
jgi:hypothetical protein